MITQFLLFWEIPAIRQTEVATWSSRMEYIVRSSSSAYHPFQVNTNYYFACSEEARVETFLSSPLQQVWQQCHHLPNYDGDPVLIALLPQMMEGGWLHLFLHAYPSQEVRWASRLKREHDPISDLPWLPLIPAATCRQLCSNKQAGWSLLGAEEDSVLSTFHPLHFLECAKPGNLKVGRQLLER